MPTPCKTPLTHGYAAPGSEEQSILGCPEPCSKNTPLSHGYAPPGSNEQTIIGCQPVGHLAQGAPQGDLAFTGFNVLVVLMVGLALIAVAIATYRTTQGR